MASPIGSSFSPLPPARPQPADARAAQRAFFSQALAAAQAAPPAAAAPAPLRAQAAQPLQAAVAAPPPDRPMRPGSLLDIKV